MSGARLREGAGAGLIGGIVVALWAGLMCPILGTDPHHETRLAAASLLGDAALRPGSGPLALLVGGTCHLAVSIAWGIAFALVGSARSPIAMLAAGAVFGVGVWLMMHHVLLPALGMAWIVADFSTARAVTEHVVYGIGVALGMLGIRRAAG
jgi:hypothetical protein